MDIIVKIIIVWIIYLFIPVLSSYLLAVLSQMPVREVSIGTGKQLFKVGVVAFKILPISSRVNLAAINLESETISPLEKKPFLFRIFWLIFGSFILALIYLFINPSMAASAFVSGLYQPFVGMFSPFNAAQKYLQSFYLFVQHQEALSIAGLIGIKVLAINIIFVSENTLSGAFKKLTDSKSWTYALQQKVFMFLWLFIRALILLWLIALLYFIYKTLA
jgi:hypothetical protein